MESPAAGKRALVVFGGITPLHDTKVGGAGADVDDQGVQQRFQAVSYGEGFGNQHDAVGDAFHGVAQVLPADPKRLRGHADHGAHFRFVFAFLLDAGEVDQVFEDLLHRLLVFLRTFLHDAPFERTAQIEHGAVIERFAADQDGFFDDFARHHIQRPTDVAVDHMALAVGCGDGAARGAKIDADAEGFVAFFHA